MLNFLLRPTTLFMISIYVGFIYWLINGTKSKNTGDFPWGMSFVEIENEKYSALGEASYHFYSEENSYIDYKHFNHLKEGIYMEFIDGKIPEKIKFQDFEYNKFSRTLTATCNFQANNMGYLNVFFDHYIYENNYEFSRASGYQLDKGSYADFLPFNFPNGAEVIIEACGINNLDDDLAEIFIRFEKDQYPNNEPSYETESIKIGNEMNTYTLAIPKSPPGIGYSSVLMYLKNINTSVIIKDIMLKYEKKGKEITKKLIFSDSFGSADLKVPFNNRDLRWEYKFKFSKDFSKIIGGHVEIHTAGYEPWKINYGPNWYYKKLN